MEILLEKLEASITMSTHLRAVSFLSSMQHDLIITLIYDKPLSDDWKCAAVQLEAALLNHNNNISNISIIGS